MVVRTRFRLRVKHSISGRTGTIAHPDYGSPAVQGVQWDNDDEPSLLFDKVPTADLTSLNSVRVWCPFYQWFQDFFDIPEELESAYREAVISLDEATDDAREQMEDDFYEAWGSYLAPYACHPMAVFYRKYQQQQAIQGK